MKPIPGEVYDKNDRPIYPGDLLRSFHFRGVRRKVYWLYHVVVLREGHLEMVPTSHLEPTEAARKGGGRCWLSPDLAAAAEIIDGYGGPGRLHFEDRPKRAKTEAA